MKKITKKELNEIKKELRLQVKKYGYLTGSITRYGIQFLFFTQMANGRKNVFKAGINDRGIFSTKEI